MSPGGRGGASSGEGYDVVMTTDGSRLPVSGAGTARTVPDITPAAAVAAPVDASVSARMSSQRPRDTTPEIALRRELHRGGLRFRIEYPLPGIPRRRADIVFTRARVAVFVDGCFWHSCPLHATVPNTRREWWVAKLEGNVARDRDTDRRLGDAGWRVVRVWEHEDVREATRRIAEAIGEVAPK